MVRLCAAVIGLCATVALGQTPGGDTVQKKAWTVLVYGAADNNADGPILEFLDSVRAAIDDDAGIDLLLLIDRHEKYSTDATSLGEDFTGARLFRLKKNSAERLSGGSYFPGITVDRDEELDSSDAANIGRFVMWGKAQSPAERYALMIYSHANGRTMCPDEQSRGDMGIPELTEKVGEEARVDFLALELCTMGGIEIAYQWRPGTGRFCADVLLAIPNAGPPLDWDRAFWRIRSKGHATTPGLAMVDPASMTARDFGKLVIEEGYDGRVSSRRRGPSFESAGSYDLHAAAKVKESVDAMARVLAANDKADAFLDVRKSGAMVYERGGPFVDLYDIAKKAADCESLSIAAREAARHVMEATDAFVLDSFGMDGYTGFEPGKNGVFITMPRREMWKRMAWYTPEPGKERGWAFLRDGGTAKNGVADNWFELLDLWLDDGERGINGYRP